MPPPPRPSKIPPRPAAIPEGFQKIHVNRLFESVEEIQRDYPNAIIFRTWTKSMIGCELLIHKSK